MLLLVLGFSEEGIALSEQHKTRISVEIYGQTYKMVGPETSGHMRLVASMVDDKMREINSHNSQLDTCKTSSTNSC